DEGGNDLRPWKAEPFDVKTMLAVGNIVPQPAAFYSVDALEAIGSLDDHWHLIMDYELSIRIGTRYRTVCIPSTLAKFRAHSQSKSRLRFEALAAELIDLLDELKTDQPALREWLFRRTASSRIYYELSLTYLREDGLAGSAL